MPNSGLSDELGNGVVIFLSNGDGTFQQSPVVLQTGSEPAFLISGDFNNDGKADLAIGNAGDNSMNIFLGNGDGTFTSAPSPDPGGQPQGIVLGDFNQDGNADLAILTNFGVTILLGKGDGSFTAPTPISAVNLRGIAVADFNGDGKPDLAATVSPSKSSSPLPGQWRRDLYCFPDDYANRRRAHSNRNRGLQQRREARSCRRQSG